MSWIRPLQKVNYFHEVLVCEFCLYFRSIAELAPRKRKRRSAFKVNSVASQGSSEFGNESPPRALEIPLVSSQ